MPKKEKDPRTFCVSCEIGKHHIRRCLADLGVSVNVMSTSWAEFLGIDSIEETPIVLELADQTMVKPVGIVEDLLVKISNLVFLVDFYIVEFKKDSKEKPAPLIFGRPFLSTATAKIDVHEGTLVVGSGNKTVEFCIDDMARELHSKQSFYEISILEDDELDEVLQKYEEEMRESDDDEDNEDVDETEELYLYREVQEELKELPHDLKYEFIKGKSFPIMISNTLSVQEEEKLLQLLREKTQAIAWNMKDIGGISATVFQHRIKFINDEAYHIEPVKRLNPNVLEVIKKHIMKLLDANVIYPVADSRWVSAIHLVPK